MRVLKVGSLTVRAIGGTDRMGGGDGPAIVLCHGYGVPGNNLVLLPRRVQAEQSVRWFFPEGPLSVGAGTREAGRAWYAIDAAGIRRRIDRGEPAYPLEDEIPAGMLEASSKLDECLDALVADHRVDPLRLVVGGFSQGAVMATEIALRRRPLVSGLAVLSGRLLSRERMLESLREIGPALRVFQAHGAADVVIAHRNGQALRAALLAGGARVDWLLYDGGHEITSDVRDALGAFCKKVLSEADPSLPGGAGRL